MINKILNKYWHFFFFKFLDTFVNKILVETLVILLLINRAFEADYTYIAWGGSMG